MSYIPEILQHDPLLQEFVEDAIELASFAPQPEDWLGATMNLSREMGEKYPKEWVAWVLGKATQHIPIGKE